MDSRLDGVHYEVNVYPSLLLGGYWAIIKTPTHIAACVEAATADDIESAVRMAVAHADGNIILSYTAEQLLKSPEPRHQRRAWPGCAG